MKAGEDIVEEYYDAEDIKKYMSLSVEEKLTYLEEAHIFFSEAVPVESKKAWEKLKKKGW